jgi:hypothetical protein
MVTMNKMAHSICEFNICELFDQVQAQYATRAAVDPLNVKPRPANLELRRGFLAIEQH